MNLTSASPTLPLLAELGTGEGLQAAEPSMPRQAGGGIEKYLLKKKPIT